MQTLHSIGRILRAKPSGKKIIPLEIFQQRPVKGPARSACAGIQQNKVCLAFFRLCKAFGIRHAEGLPERPCGQPPQPGNVSGILLPVELGDLNDARIQQARHRFRCFVHEHAHGLDPGGKLCF